MPYNTYSSQAPSNNTGSVTSGLTVTVQNNALHASAESVKYPSYYDQFVNKTNSNYNTVISITDENRSLSDVYITAGQYAGYLYLYHRPVNGTTFTLSNGNIVTGATDYTNGIVYFSSVPSTNAFTISYFAVPDAIFADHINALQNATMAIERTIGAGNNSGEGLKNASFWLDALPASLNSITPNGVNTRALTKDVQLKSASSQAHTITIGNGGDTVTLDARNLTITNSDPSYSTSGRFGDDNNDKFYFNGLVAITPTGGLISSVYQSGCVFAVGDPTKSTNTGVSPSPTGYPLPSGSRPLVRFFGDLQVIGNIYLTGAITATPTTTGNVVSVISNTLAVGQDLYVTGNTTLGSNTTKTTTINGPAVLGRSIHVKSLGDDVSRFDGPIDFRNPGNINNNVGGVYPDTTIDRGTQYFPDLPFHVGNNFRNSPGQFTDLTVNKNATIDGLDPSYLAKLLRRRALDRHDFKANMVNDCSRFGFNGSVTAVPSPGTTTWYDTGLCMATGLGVFTGMFPGSTYSSEGDKPFRWFHLGGDYYHGKFGNEQFRVKTGEFQGYYQYGDGNGWKLLWTQNDTTTAINPGAYKYGSNIPLKVITPSYQTGSPFVATGALLEISRPFNTSVQVGDSYKLYHPTYSKGYAIRINSTTSVQIYASDTEPIIANINGIHKVVTVPCIHDLSSLTNYTGNVYFYVDLDTPEIAKQSVTPGSLLDTEATVVYDTVLMETDSRVALGEVFVDLGQDPSITTTGLITYAPNARYDSLWFRCSNTGNLTQNNGRNEFSWYIRNYTGSSPTNAQDMTNTGSIEGTTTFIDVNSRYGGYYIGDVLVHDSNVYKTRIYHHIGVRERFNIDSLKVFVAPNLGYDYSPHSPVVDFREGPDYGYVRKLDPIKSPVGGSSVVNYPCYDIVHLDRNYMDIVIYNIAQIPGAIIGARTTTGNRNFALTGNLGSSTGYGTSTTPADRNRFWWWTRVVIN